MNDLPANKSIVIPLKSKQLHQLDLSSVHQWLEPILAENDVINYEQKIQFEINYPREETDPRELSEIPEVRLWFLRLDAVYPWFPFFLNWKSGEFARYTAMLIPHQFHRTEGIQYNPEALELFLMQKIFILADWLGQYNISSQTRLKSMAQLLGYDLDDQFLHFLTNVNTPKN